MEDQNQPGGQWQFRPDDTSASAAAQPAKLASGEAPARVAQTTPNQATITSVTWTASEFIEHQKSASWYLLLAVATVVVAGGLYWLIHDLITSIIIGIVAIIFGITAARKPRQISYALDSKGITIGSRFLPYADFRSFTVDQEGAFASVSLMPLKRFAPMTVIYLDPQDEDRILNLLSEYLPLDQTRTDAVERLMRRIRF